MSACLCHLPCNFHMYSWKIGYIPDPVSLTSRTMAKPWLPHVALVSLFLDLPRDPSIQIIPIMEDQMSNG